MFRPILSGSTLIAVCWCSLSALNRSLPALQRNALYQRFIITGCPHVMKICRSRKKATESVCRKLLCIRSAKISRNGKALRIILGITKRIIRLRRISPNWKTPLTPVRLHRLLHPVNITMNSAFTIWILNSNPIAAINSKIVKEQGRSPVLFLSLSISVIF